MRKEKIINFIETKNEKLQEKKARRTTWVSQDAGLKAAPGRFSQVEDFFHARSSSLVDPHLAKPFPVVRHAAKIAHKVCENRKIYLKFLNKPNFNVPKNWGKIFGKTA